MKVLTMKYCINCKHFSPAKDDLEHQYARCSYNQTPSLVTGTLVRSGMPFCFIARGSGHCKEAATNYEEKAVSHA